MHQPRMPMLCLRVSTLIFGRALVSRSATMRSVWTLSQIRNLRLAWRGSHAIRSLSISSELCSRHFVWGALCLTWPRSKSTCSYKDVLMFPIHHWSSSAIIWGIAEAIDDIIIQKERDGVAAIIFFLFCLHGGVPSPKMTRWYHIYDR